VAGLIAFDHGAENDLDPVVAAAVLAFGFVYIHPFEDGNGRIHRYLMHHVLARRGFNPPGVHFPVSAAILDKIDEYRRVLESYSSRLLPLVQWEPTEKGNANVLNDTGDFYRFFDATPHAEFLYACVRKTIDEDLPNEANFLRNFDQFRAGIEDMIDMPERTLNTLFGFLRQNGGRLSKRARTNEFAELTENEVKQIETLYTTTFGESVAENE
jgi:Fic family protein